MESRLEDRGMPRYLKGSDSIVNPVRSQISALIVEETLVEETPVVYTADLKELACKPEVVEKE